MNESCAFCAHRADAHPGSGPCMAEEIWCGGGIPCDCERFLSERTAASLELEACIVCRGTGVGGPDANCISCGGTGLNDQLDRISPTALAWLRADEVCCDATLARDQHGCEHCRELRVELAGLGLLRDPARPMWAEVA